MAQLLDAAVFTALIVILLQIAPQRRAQDIQVWSDDVERRMMR